MADHWTIVPVTHQRGQICRDILSALPDWFGRSDSIEAYVTAAQTQPMFAAVQSGKAVGFVSICQHFAESFEVHSLGVLQPLHRAGIGRALIRQAALYAIAQNGRFLSVKTLADAWVDENYARTRAFYLGVGFKPIEVFETLWGDMPCLFLIMPVAA